MWGINMTHYLDSPANCMSTSDHGAFGLKSPAYLEMIFWYFFHPRILVVAFFASHSSLASPKFLHPNTGLRDPGSVIDLSFKATLHGMGLNIWSFHSSPRATFIPSGSSKPNPNRSPECTCIHLLLKSLGQFNSVCNIFKGKGDVGYLKDK